MLTRTLTLAFAALTLVGAGCASNFRAGGPHLGVEAGAAVGPPVRSTPASVTFREPPPAHLPPPSN